VVLSSRYSPTSCLTGRLGPSSGTVINGPRQNAAQQTCIPRIATSRRHHCVSFLEPKRAVRVSNTQLTRFRRSLSSRWRVRTSPLHLGMPSLSELAEQGYGRAYWTRSQPERSRAQSKHSRKRGPRIGPRRTSAVDQLVWPETKQAQHETDRNAGPLGRNEVVKRTVCVFRDCLEPEFELPTPPIRRSVLSAVVCLAPERRVKLTLSRRCRTAVVYSRLGVPLKVSAVPMSRAGPIGPTH